MRRERSTGYRLEVARQEVGARACDGDRDQLASQTEPRGVRDSGRAATPAVEVLLRRGPVRPQVPAGDLDQCFVVVELPPTGDPPVRPHERDALPATWPETKQAISRDRLEHAAPARPEPRQDVFRA